MRAIWIEGRERVIARRGHEPTLSSGGSTVCCLVLSNDDIRRFFADAQGTIQGDRSLREPQRDGHAIGVGYFNGGGQCAVEQLPGRLVDAYVSRQTVREAVRRLVDEGVCVTQPSLPWATECSAA